MIHVHAEVEKNIRNAAVKTHNNFANTYLNLKFIKRTLHVICKVRLGYKYILKGCEL